MNALDDPAPEGAEPDIWLCSAPPGVWSSGRVEATKEFVQSWRDKDYECEPFYRHPLKGVGEREAALTACLNEAARKIDAIARDAAATIERLGAGLIAKIRENDALRAERDAAKDGWAGAFRVGIQHQEARYAAEAELAKLEKEQKP